MRVKNKVKLPTDCFKHFKSHETSTIHDTKTPVDLNAEYVMIL